MARGNWKNCSKTAPCPVCGATDWCSWFPKKDGTGEYVLSCKRAFRDGAAQDSVQGRDGKMYRFMSSKNGQYFYTEDSMNNEVGRTYERRVVARSEPIIVNPVKVASDESLDIVYRALLDKLILEDRHADYLRKEGWTEEMIQLSNIKSFPENDYAREQGFVPYKTKNLRRWELADAVMDELHINSLRGVPGAYIKDKKWTFGGPSGIILPIYDFPDNNFYQKITRARIRMDFLGIKPCVMKDGYPAFKEASQYYYLDMGGPFQIKNGMKCRIDRDDFKGKVRPLHSYHVDPVKSELGYIVNTYECGCESENRVSFYVKEEDNMEMWFIIEGEKKGQYANYRLNAPVASLPGVNSWGMLFDEDKNGLSYIDKMKSLGAKIFCVAYDADKVINKTVLYHEKALVEELKRRGEVVVTTDWNLEHGKGLDDLLAAGGFPEFKLK